VAFICQKFCYNKEDAEEALQDTFYIAYTKAGKLRSETILPYLRRIAIHECYRKRYAAKDTLLSNTYIVDNREESDIDFLPEAYINVQEQRTELLRIIMGLPKMQWETIYLYYYASFTTDEIARLHKCSTSNVRKTLRNARAAIKDHLEGKRKKSASKGVLMASAGTLSLAALFLLEEQVFAAVYIPLAAPCWAGATAATAIVATSSSAAAAAGGYVVAACVAVFVAASAVTYITLWPDAAPAPTNEPYIAYVQAPITEPTTPAPTPQPTLPTALETEPPTEPETDPPTEAPTPAPTTAPLTTPVVYVPQPTTPPPTTPEPAPDRTAQILAALATATTQTQVQQIINTYGFQFERVIRMGNEELQFYVTNEGSGDILIGTATCLDDFAFDFVFSLFASGHTPSTSMDLITFIERNG